MSPPSPRLRYRYRRIWDSNLQAETIRMKELVIFLSKNMGCPLIGDPVVPNVLRAMPRS